MQLTYQFDEIGSYWERGNKNEIDIVAINRLKKRLLVAEVKLNKKRIDMSLLKIKAKKLVEKLKGYRVEYVGYSLEDM